MSRLGWSSLVLSVFAVLTLSGCGGGGDGGGGGGGGGGSGNSSFTVGGTIGGLSGSVILRLNGGNDLPVNAPGTFTFPTQLANAASYAVTILTQPGTQVCGPVVVNGTGTINGANVTNLQLTCETYSIGGTVAGLKADMKLVVNGSVEIPVSANATSFTSPPGMSLGAVGLLYNVAIKTQPAGQTCTIVRTTGAVAAGAANISGATGPAVDCIDNITDAFTGTYLLEGVEDDAGFGVVSFNADGTYLLGVRNDEPASANDVCAGKSGVQYGVYNWNRATQVLRIVKHAPIGFGDDCGLDVGTAVVVSPNVGDDDGGLTLIEPGSNPPLVAGQMIAVESTAGTLIGSWGDPQAFVVFTSDNKFFLATTRAIVQNTAHSPGIEHGCYSLSAGNTSGSFTFNLTAACTIDGIGPVDSTGSSGFSAIGGAPNFTVNGDVIQAVAGGVFVTPLTGSATRIVPTQLPSTYSISASISGLSASGLILQANGKSGPPVDANAMSATVATGIGSGATYLVTVQQQPTGLYCTVANGSGVAFANVTSVAVSCAAVSPTTYTVSGTVNNLGGTGLALRLNDQPGAAFNVNPTAPPAPASYTFTAGLTTGTPFAVTVLSQPTSPIQFCFNATPAAGTINGSNVTVHFNCITSSPSVVSGAVSGLAAGQSLQLRLNYTDAAGVPAAHVNGAVNANGAFNVFSGNAVPANGVFELGIASEPAGQTCTITRSHATAIANFANVSIVCLDNPASVLTGTYSSLNPQGDGRWYFNFNADGTYTTATIHNEWACDGTRNGNGVEYGVFRWNPATGEFQQPVPAAIDTNDDCGFYSDGDAFSGYITRAGNAIELRETQNGPLIASVPAVQSNAGTLVGGWAREAGNGSLLVFHADGTFLHVETQTFFVGLPDPTGLNGQERGCYTASAPASGTITVTIDAACRPDDLASYDLSPAGGLVNVPVMKTRSYPFTLAGDTLTFNGIVFKRTRPN